MNDSHLSPTSVEVAVEVVVAAAVVEKVEK